MLEFVIIVKWQKENFEDLRRYFGFLRSVHLFLPNPSGWCCPLVLLSRRHQGPCSQPCTKPAGSRKKSRIESNPINLILSELNLFAFILSYLNWTCLHNIGPHLRIKTRANTHPCHLVLNMFLHWVLSYTKDKQILSSCLCFWAWTFVRLIFW